MEGEPLPHLEGEFGRRMRPLTDRCAVLQRKHGDSRGLARERDAPALFRRHENLVLIYEATVGRAVTARVVQSPVGARMRHADDGRVLRCGLLENGLDGPDVELRALGLAADVVQSVERDERQVDLIEPILDHERDRRVGEPFPIRRGVHERPDVRMRPVERAGHVAVTFPLTDLRREELHQFLRRLPSGDDPMMLQPLRRFGE